MRVDAVGHHHRERGQQRHHRRPQEAPPGLEVGGQHDGDPVERQLDREDPQQRRAEADAGLERDGDALVDLRELLEGEAQGELLIDGVPAASVRGRAGMVLQDPDSQTILARVGDDVAFGCENLGVPRAQIWPRVRAALDAGKRVLGICLGGQLLAELSNPQLVTAHAAAASGLEVARASEAAAGATRPEVIRVMHPALPQDPGHALWQDQFSGASGLFGFVIRDVPRPALAAMMDGLDLFGMGASWGGYESLLIPTDPRPHRSATEWAAGGQTMRMHVGLENPDELIDDLDRGFARMAAACATGGAA